MIKDQLRRLDCTIERHSDGYHHSTEFWVGFADYPHDSNCRNPWSNNETAEAWDRGWETGMRTTLKRTPHYEWSEYDMDDISTLALTEGLRSLIKEQRRPEKLAARQLHLVVDNTE